MAPRYVIDNNTEQHKEMHRDMVTYQCSLVKHFLRKTWPFLVLLPVQMTLAWLVQTARREKVGRGRCYSEVLLKKHIIPWLE